MVYFEDCMASKIEKILPAFQRNAWPAMLQTLARDLGVTAASLAMLDIGWAPIVEFKKGLNYQGWWVIPERDETGKPIGLSLRSREGFKCMYPGSQHGLVYPVNPDHAQGEKAYRHGAHNWERLYDAGVECPVCNKPDGCLVSSEDPEDPQAAICIRVSEGADKPMKFGYLHILKSSGRVAADSPLPASDYPVLIVEGMTDTAAALDLGLIAVGRPSNRAGLTQLKALIRGRDVLVLGENDDVNPQTGERPGHAGMVAAFQMLKGAAKSIKQAMPPEHVKDLREWVSAGGLTRDTLLSHFEDEGREPAEEKVLADSRGLTLAHAFLKSRYRLNGKVLLRYHKGRWFKWNGVKYEEVDERTDIRGPIHEWAYDKQVIHTTAKGEESILPLNCNITMVNNIMDAMLNPCPIPQTPPCWLDNAPDVDPQNLIVFQNGILCIDRFLAGADKDEYLLPLTPDFFTTFALPVSFDETAQCPRWRSLCQQNLADRDKEAMLQEWFGLNLTPVTKYQKMMLMRGPAGAGKSLIANMIGKMVGEGQWVAPNFADLSSDFGLQTLVGSQAAIMDEAKIPQRADAMQALETILKITGEGTFDIQRKYLPALQSYKFATKFTLTCNELPALPDHSGAMKRRLLILDFPRSFEAEADPHLEEELRQELTGIILWALEGYRRLQRRGRFTIPQESLDSLKEWQTSTSPMAAFVEECCVEGDDHEIDKHELFDAWQAWASERGIKPIGKTRMLERLKANATYMHTATYMHGGHKQSVVKGLKLQPWAERNLLGKPN